MSRTAKDLAGLGRDKLIDELVRLDAEVEQLSTDRFEMERTAHTYRFCLQRLIRHARVGINAPLHSLAVAAHMAPVRLCELERSVGEPLTTEEALNLERAINIY